MVWFYSSIRNARCYMVDSPKILFVANRYEDYQRFKRAVDKKTHGYSLQYAENGIEAFREIETTSLVSLNFILVLYICNSSSKILDSLQWLHFNPKYKHLPIIVLANQTIKKKTSAFENKTFSFIDISAYSNVFEEGVEDISDILLSYSKRAE